MRRGLRAQGPKGTFSAQVLTTRGTHGNARAGATQGQGAGGNAPAVEGASGRDGNPDEHAGNRCDCGATQAQGGGMTTTTTETTERRAFGTIYGQRRSPFLWIRYRVNGKEYRESTRSTSFRVAENLLTKRQTELGLGAFIAPNLKRTTFDDVVEMIRNDYIVNGKKSLDTLDTLIKRLRQVFEG